MKQNILTIAKNKFKELTKQYNGFINIIVDDWRGFRFVFDTKDVRKCDNKCENCPLFLLLKKEKQGLFSAGLYPANEKDKKIFGPQNFLNCKTLQQYQQCYIKFLLKKANAKKKIEDELDLILDAKIIYSKYSDNKKINKNFKKTIISRSIQQCSYSKKKIIQDYLLKNNLQF